MDDASTWKLIHHQRAAVADLLESLTPEQWAAPSLCGGWTVRAAAGHIVVGAENTTGNFLRRMAANGFRFNKMIDADAKIAGRATPAELVARLRPRTTTTNRPAPAVTMLGEVVAHTEDIAQPLGLRAAVDPAATIASLDLYAGSSFPLGSKKRIAGIRLVASDIGWSHGDGPEVTGPGLAVLLAMTGRPVGLDQLSGDGVAMLRQRLG